MKIHKLKNIIYLILLSVLSLFIIILPVSANVFDIIEIRNISDDRKTNVITWNTNVKTSSQGWIVADQYLYIHYDKNHTISTGWGLEIYTDNKTNTANPMYIGPSDDPSGLIKTATSNVVLPLAWRIFKEIQTNVPDPLERADHSGFQDYAWHFLQDKRSPSFLNEKDYLVPYDQGGIAWHEGSRQNKPTNAYVYIAANFDYAANFEYKTSMLKLVEFNNPTLPKFLMNYFYVYYNVWKDQEPVPNHFIPAYEDWGGGAIPTTINFEYTADYKSPGSCINITFGGTSKGALVWYEPGSDYNCPSGPGVGYNLTGATRLSFW
ncbi:MAG: hypothetical protein KKH98_13140, partial [Spirochaetes bacterium]|nr:hypothetical protein [Spirochaetota bacterium]